MVDYLDTIQDITNELDPTLGAPIPNQFLITHTLNGVDQKFKENTVVVRAWDTMITLDELNDKLVEYEAFRNRKNFAPLEILVTFLLLLPNFNTLNK